MWIKKADMKFHQDHDLEGGALDHPILAEVLRVMRKGVAEMTREVRGQPLNLGRYFKSGVFKGGWLINGARKRDLWALNSTCALTQVGNV